MTQQIPEQDRVNPKNQSRQTDGRERRGCLEERERPERPERRGRKPDRRRDLYLRIAADIDAGILSGKLPGVLKLAQRYQACHGTVQNAIRLLADAGYILVRPRSGCYVRRRLEVVMAGLYLESQQVLNLPDAYTNFMANLGPLYQSLHDTLEETGVPLSFEVIDVGNAEAVRRLKRPNRHVVVNFPLQEPERYYPLLEGCSWTRVSGTFDPECPAAHFACDNPAIGRLAAERLLRKGCRNFLGIGSRSIGLFRQRFEAFAEVLENNGAQAEHLEIDSFRMNLPEILSRMRIALTPRVREAETGGMGIFCAADAFMQPLQQVLEHLPEGTEKAVIVSCDNNPYFLQNVTLRSDEIDIGMKEIGKAVGAHILSDPDRPEKRVFPPVLRER